jgi:hypothetical protein
MPEHAVDHVPPEGVPVSVVEEPTQVESVPVMVGAGLTVTTAVALHPVAEIVTVTTPVPALSPVTTPDASTEIVPLDVLQVTPVVVVLSVVVAPTQTLSVPVIAAGFGLMVTIAEVVQPVGPVATTVAVPGATPVTIPVVAPTTTVPEPGIVVHVTPVVVDERVILAPTHTLPGPVIVAGAELTVTVETVKQPPGNM